MNKEKKDILIIADGEWTKLAQELIDVVYSHRLTAVETLGVFELVKKDLMERIEQGE